MKSLCDFLIIQPLYYVLISTLTLHFILIFEAIILLSQFFRTQFDNYRDQMKYLPLLINTIFAYRLKNSPGSYDFPNPAFQTYDSNGCNQRSTFSEVRSSEFILDVPAPIIVREFFHPSSVLPPPPPPRLHDLIDRGVYRSFQNMRSEL